MPAPKVFLYCDEQMEQESQFQPHTPTGSELEEDGFHITSHAPQDDYEGDEDVEMEEEPVDSDERDIEPLPRRLLKSCFGKKRPRAVQPEEDDEQNPSDCDNEHIGNGDMDIPDLKAYFAFFVGFTEIDQVKMCRSYATYLSSKTPKNRLRYSAKSAKTWNKK